MAEVLDRIVKTREEAHAAEKKRAYNRARYAANTERIKAHVAAYKVANSEKVKALAAAYSKANHAKVSAYQVEYRAQHREEKRLAAIEYRKKNPEKCKARIEAWHAAHPEARRAKRADRLAARRNAKGRISRDIYQRLTELQRGKCAGCGACLEKAGTHLDHVVALANGGEHIDSNLQLLCPPCNLSKSDKDPIAWAQERGRLL